MTVSMTWPQYRRCTCTVGDFEVHIPGRSAANVLLLLLLRRGYLVTHEEFIVWLWPNPDFEPDYVQDLVHRYVLSLRQTGIEIIEIIETVYGQGYRICH